jgi:hypothetical protein
MGGWILDERSGGTEMDLPELLSQAGEGNRTLVSSLEGYSFTIKLHPRLAAKIAAPTASCQMLFLDACQPLPALLALLYV